MMNVNRSVDAARDALRPQVRLMAAGAGLGVVLLGGSLVVDLAGLNDPTMPTLPTTLPGSTSIPRLPSGFPSMPVNPTALPTGLPTGIPTGLPSGLPTDFPTGLPTTLPKLPTDLPGAPAAPGGAP